MARHKLAAQLDQTAVHLIDLVDPLHEWQDLDYPLPKALGHFSVSSFLDALGGIIHDPVAASNISGRIGRSALVEWLLAAQPASPTDATPKVPVRHITARTNKVYSKSAYSTVMALNSEPGSPALRIELVMSDVQRPVVTDEGVASYKAVESAEVNFGRLAADGGVKGVFVPFTETNVNHGAEWGDVPDYKNPAGMVALLSEVDLVLASTAEQLAKPALDF